MSVVVTVMNMKGGVGKTTVATHVAGALAIYARPSKAPLKVLLIDYDAQFNLSQVYLPAEKYFELEKKGATILSVLQDDVSNFDPYQLQVPGNNSPPSVKELAVNIYTYSYGSLDLVPSTLDLMYVALGRVDVQIGPIEERFAKFIAECRENYDLTIVDCHPAGSLLTKTALSNSDHVLIPVVPEGYAVRGIGLMLKFIEAKQKGGVGPRPHVLFNRVGRSGGPGPHELTIRGNKDYGKYCLGPTLKKYAALSQPAGGVGFVWFSGAPYSSEASHNVRQVASAFADRIGV